MAGISSLCGPVCLPKNIEAEKGVLAILLREPFEVFERGGGWTIREEDFTDHGHRILFESCADLMRLGFLCVEEQTLLWFILRSARYHHVWEDTSSIWQALRMARTVDADVKHLSLYVKIVREKALLRELISMLELSLMEIFSNNLSFNEVIERTVGHVACVARHGRPGESLDSLAKSGSPEAITEQLPASYPRTTFDPSPRKPESLD